MKGTLIKIDRNGTKYYEGYVPCPRCDGKGIYYIGECNGQLVPSWVDGGVCFQCGGSGHVVGKWIERTPEYQAKLDARREAKRQAEQEIIEAERKQKEAEEEAKRQAEALAKAKQEAEIKAKKERSNFRGAIGDKIDEDVTFDHSAWFEIPSFYGYGSDRVYIHTFRDADGNALVWKTSTNPCGKFEGDAWIPFEEGQKVHLKGTIKEFKEYKDEKQTCLTRCKVQA